MSAGDNGQPEQTSPMGNGDVLFQEMANGLPLLVWVHDAAGEQVMVNDTFCEFFGVTREAMKGGRWQMLVHPEDAEDYTNEFFACLRERRHFHSEVRVERADGEWRWLESWGRPRLSETGEFRGFVGASADVTDKKWREHALRVAAERDQTRAALVDALRPLTSAVEVEAAATRVLGERLGLSRAYYGEVDDDGEQVRIHADYHDGVPSLAGRYRLDDYGPAAMKVFRAGKTLVVENVDEDARLTDEQRAATAGLHIGAYILVPLIKRGRPVALLAVNDRKPRAWSTNEIALVEDVAERTWSALERARAEEQLRRAHALIEGITEGTEDLIAAEDLDFRYTYFNDAYRREFKKLWGQEIEAGTNMVEAMAPWPQEQQKAKELWSRALRGESFRVEMDFGPSPQEKHVYDLRFNPIRDSDGRITGAAHIFRDVTERVRVEQALRDNEERLRQSDRRKDEYLAMLGHELRNPLAAIRSATELIRRTQTGDPRLQRASGALERQSAHMARLIDGLLEVSRIARGKIDLKWQTLDVRDVLDGVCEDRREQIEACGLELKQELPSGPVWVEGDNVRLAQVFDNLVANAIKFSKAPGTITVAVACDDTRATIAVRDTGMGIRPEMLDVIFESFQQAPQDAARSTGGLGLGLPLARGLVELHSGTIEAFSAGPGTGAELQVRLPLTDAPPPTRRPDDSPEAPRRRILIVEDNVDAAEGLRDLLELEGHDATVAYDASGALDVLRSRGADIVLCDLGLPGMSGYELARAIRGDASLRDVPLVALTGYGQPEDRERTAAAGFHEHLTKPLDLDAVQEAVGRLVRQ